MPPEPHTTMDVKHHVGTLELNVSFASAAPWTVIFGPSGSGKSTTLRLLAGLERPVQGAITLLGQPVFLVREQSAALWVPTHERPMRWAAQRAILMPRRTVREQVAMGCVSPDEVAAALEHFELRPLANKRPEELSGGQRQLVAVVRAAAGARGRLLLLDEPFAGLDALVRDNLIANLQSWLDSTPVISVTHDVGEAFLLKAEVVRMNAGCVVAQGPVEDVLAEERVRLKAVLG